VDQVHPDAPSKAETIAIDVMPSMTLFVMVDGIAPRDKGNFNLEIHILPPEGPDLLGGCSDFSDNDDDGYIDCDDPTGCQKLSACTPGAAVTGAACTSQTDCAANNNDPICLADKQGYAGGYCSEFCELSAPDCAGDAVCANIGFGSVHGVCLDGCMTDADCRPSYACADKGLSSKVCGPPPESICNDYIDNDNNGLLDCDDPGCKASADCAPGAKVSGLPCTSHSDCFANANDPFCIADAQFGYPGGYCSEFCDLAQNDCGPAAICASANTISLASDHGLCFHTCAGPIDCRQGYSCLDIGSPKKVCIK
jgi:hypothetical protein